MKKFKPASLHLPIQTLDWSAVPDKAQKILLQFEIYVSKSGRKRFGLVVYPAWKTGKHWKFGSAIELANKKRGGSIALPLPLTLGNLEISCKALKDMNLDEDAVLLFTPVMFSANPHAAYDVTLDGDRTGSGDVVTANPSPPARPQDV